MDDDPTDEVSDAAPLCVEVPDAYVLRFKAPNQSPGVADGIVSNAVTITVHSSAALVEFVHEEDRYEDSPPPSDADRNTFRLVLDETSMEVLATRFAADNPAGIEILARAVAAGAADRHRRLLKVVDRLAQHRYEAYRIVDDMRSAEADGSQSRNSSRVEAAGAAFETVQALNDSMAALFDIPIDENDVLLWW